MFKNNGDLGAKKPNSTPVLPTGDFAKRLAENMKLVKEKLPKESPMDKHRSISVEDAAKALLEHNSCVIVRKIQQHILERSSEGHPGATQSLAVLLRNDANLIGKEAIVELCTNRNNSHRLLKIVRGKDAFVQNCSEDLCKLYYAILRLTWTVESREFLRKQLEEKLGVTVESIAEQGVAETNKFCCFGFYWGNLV